MLDVDRPRRAAAARARCAVAASSHASSFPTRPNRPRSTFRLVAQDPEFQWPDRLRAQNAFTPAAWREQLRACGVEMAHIGLLPPADADGAHEAVGVERSRAEHFGKATEAMRRFIRAARAGSCACTKPSATARRAPSAQRCANAVRIAKTSPAPRGPRLRFRLRSAAATIARRNSRPRRHPPRIGRRTTNIESAMRHGRNSVITKVLQQLAGP